LPRAADARPDEVPGSGDEDVGPGEEEAATGREGAANPMTLATTMTMTAARAAQA
jgi:hypothetical protein